MWTPTGSTNLLIDGQLNYNQKILNPMQTSSWRPLFIQRQRMSEETQTPMTCALSFRYFSNQTIGGVFMFRKKRNSFIFLIIQFSIHCYNPLNLNLNSNLNIYFD